MLAFAPMDLNCYVHIFFVHGEAAGVVLGPVRFGGD